MTISYFFDTSAIMKAYVSEPGSEWVGAVMGKRGPSPRVFISELARVEVVSTLYKIERENRVDPALTNWARNKFEHELRIQQGYKGARYVVVYLSADSLDRAASLLERDRSGAPQGLRSLDSIQLACAVVARDTLPTTERGELRFVTLGRQLAGCAADEGFTVSNPMTAPPPRPRRPARGRPSRHAAGSAGGGMWNGTCAQSQRGLAEPGGPVPYSVAQGRLAKDECRPPVNAARPTPRGRARGWRGPPPTGHRKYAAPGAAGPHSSAKQCQEDAWRRGGMRHGGVTCTITPW